MNSPDNKFKKMDEQLSKLVEKTDERDKVFTELREKQQTLLNLASNFTRSLREVLAGTAFSQKTEIKTVASTRTSADLKIAQPFNDGDMYPEFIDIYIYSEKLEKMDPESKGILWSTSMPDFKHSDELGSYLHLLERDKIENMDEAKHLIELLKIDPTEEEYLENIQDIAIRKIKEIALRTGIKLEDE